MYRENPLVRYGKRIVIYGLSLIMLAAILLACIEPLTLMPLPEQLSLMQVESPLVPEEILLLGRYARSERPGP
jgi:hypothetical protein